MKKTALFLTLVILLCALTGCAGTPVIYMTNCTCPTTAPASAPEATEVPEVEGALRTGLSIVASLTDSKDASAESNGQAKYDVTVVAVLVDDAGVIQACQIDSIPATVSFDASGVITSDIAAAVSTKNELGEAYGMKAYGGAKYEWNEQAAALAGYAVGKTVEQLRSGAVSESGKAVDADLASKATISLGGYVDGVEAAVDNAVSLGAQPGDQLRLAIVPVLSSSTSATAEKAGTAQLDATVAVITLNGETITSCHIDALQAKVSFDAKGVISTDLTAPVQTKNQLGEAYGMKAYAGSAYEWNEQAAAFSKYVTGKTFAQVAGIAVNEKAAPTEADLASTVTISIGNFQEVLAKAAP